MFLRCLTYDIFKRWVGTICILSQSIVVEYTREGKSAVLQHRLVWKGKRRSAQKLKGKSGPSIRKSRNAFRPSRAERNDRVAAFILGLEIVVATALRYDFTAA